MDSFPSPAPGGSLLLSFRLHARTVLIIGSGKLAASRAFACLESDAHIVLLGCGGLDNACEEVRWRTERRQIEWRDVEVEARRWRASQTACGELQTGLEDDEAALRSLISSLPSVSLVCITDTIIPSAATPTLLAPWVRSAASASRLYEISSRQHRIPTNTTDMPTLCDFAFPSTHRFRSATSGEPTALQIGITTNSKGCRLSSRINREIVARLPKGVGDAVDNVGRLRDKAKTDGIRAAESIDASQLTEKDPSLSFVDADGGNIQQADIENLPLTPNEPVPQRPLRRETFTRAEAQVLETETDEKPLNRTQRRMRWVAQVSEYWPIESLAVLDDEEIDRILSGTPGVLPRATVTGNSIQLRPDILAPAPSRHTLASLTGLSPKPLRGRILLLGSGPGHPALLTLATSRALQNADLVLSDKLVPEDVLRVIPKHVELRVARKFPGNADRAQDELMNAALAAARQGKVVVRLKQGDPMLYARASAEIEFFTRHTYPPVVIPGLSSALAAPLAAGIPVTARGVAEGVAICTGVTKGGKGGRVPSYERGTTVLVLMGVARLAEIVRGMVADSYPNYLPTCVIERGTMPDQRVVRSTLTGIVEAMSDPRIGTQRPPGMMVVGWACLGVKEGVEGVSDDEGEGLTERDLDRVGTWLGGGRFVIKEGLEESWQDI